MSTKHTPGPHLIIEAAYWRDPVQVFAGASWLLVGVLVGVLLPW